MRSHKNSQFDSGRRPVIKTLIYGKIKEEDL